MLSSLAAPETMPGAPNSNPGRQGVARLLLAAGQPDAVTVGFDLTLDAELLDLLDHAAAWQRALAGRKPLSAETFVPRAQLDASDDVRPRRHRRVPRERARHGVGGGTEGVGDRRTTRQPRAAAADRVAAAAAISDPIKAAGALLGGPAVVEGSCQACPQTSAERRRPAAVLGPRKGVLARWLQDSARVRPAAASLDDALLRDDLAGSAPVRSWAAQSPAAPYVATVDAASARALGRVAIPRRA